ncbi:hypothetical protein [Oryza sativa Japonica Group]|uniref:Uncharacterized protein B1096D03.40 n=1 Tax=Oryza sativa subsp. japonica TaxID=39947 RepID=Q5VPY5_ORYSJ|nr:hypothetical protein [Oryza sativa Japonica Group]
MVIAQYGYSSVFSPGCMVMTGCCKELDSQALHRVVGALWHGGIRWRQRFGSIREWRRRHEEIEVDSWRGIELRNGGKAALDDGRHLPELRKREGSGSAKREGFGLGARQRRRQHGNDVAVTMSQLEATA